MNVKPEEARIHFGVNLDRLLLSLTLSTNEAARKCHLDPGTIHRLRAGQRQASVSQAWMISHGLGISIDDLMEKPNRRDIIKWRERYPDKEHAMAG